MSDPFDIDGELPRYLALATQEWTEDGCVTPHLMIGSTAMSLTIIPSDVDLNSVMPDIVARVAALIDVLTVVVTAQGTDGDGRTAIVVLALNRERTVSRLVDVDSAMIGELDHDIGLPALLRHAIAFGEEMRPTMTADLRWSVRTLTVPDLATTIARSLTEAGLVASAMVGIYNEEAQ